MRKYLLTSAALFFLPGLCFADGLQGPGPIQTISIAASNGFTGSATLSSGTYTLVLNTSITGSTQCVHVNSSGHLSGTGSDCATSGITVNSTPIASGTSGKILYDNSATVGEVSPSSIAFTTGTLSLAGNFSTVGAHTLALTTSANTALTLPSSGTVATAANIATALPSATSSQLYIGTGGAGIAAVGPSFGLTGNSTIIETTSGGLLTASILPAATTSTLGAVSTDGSTITNTAGAIACATGSSSQLGCLKPDNSTITSSGGTISAVAGPAGSVVVGTTAVTSGTGGDILYDNGGTLGNVAPSSIIFTTGTLSLAGNLSTTGAHTLGFTTSANTSLTLPTAGTLATTANISTAIPSATSSQLYIGTGAAGAAATGPSFGLTGNSTLVETTSGGLLTASLLPAATTSTLGAVSTDGSTITNSSGAISCTTMTNSQIGCAKPDGSTITISGGALSAVGGSATAVTVGTTSVTSGNGGYILYNNGGTLGNEALGNCALQPTREVVAAGAVTVTAADCQISIDKTIGAATTVNLPSGVAGLKFYIADGKGDAATNNITITPAAGTIAGNSTLVLRTNYSSAIVWYTGTQWLVN